MYRFDDDWRGFDWVVVDDTLHSVASFIRRGDAGETILCAYNFTPVPWDDYRMGSELPGSYAEVFSTDNPIYGGTGNYANGTVRTCNEPQGRFPCSIHLKLPPYGACFFRFSPIEKTKD